MQIKRGDNFLRRDICNEEQIILCFGVKSCTDLLWSNTKRAASCIEERSMKTASCERMCKELRWSRNKGHQQHSERKLGSFFPSYNFRNVSTWRTFSSSNGICQEQGTQIILPQLRYHCHHQNRRGVTLNSESPFTAWSPGKRKKAAANYPTVCSSLHWYIMF